MAYLLKFLIRREWWNINYYLNFSILRNLYNNLCIYDKILVKILLFAE